MENSGEGLTQNPEAVKRESGLTPALETSFDSSAERLRKGEEGSFEVSGEDLGSLVGVALERMNGESENGIKLEPEQIKVESFQALTKVEIGGKTQLVENGSTKTFDKGQIRINLSNSGGKVKSTYEDFSAQNFDVRKTDSIVKPQFEGDQVGLGMQSVVKEQMSQRGIEIDDSSLSITEEGNLRIKIVQGREIKPEDEKIIEPESSEVEKSKEEEKPLDLREALKEAYIDALNTRGTRVGIESEAEIYRVAKNASENLDRAGEDIKLADALQKLYGSDFKKVEVPKGTSAEEERNLSHQKLKEDLDRLPDVLAEKYLERIGFNKLSKEAEDAKKEMVEKTNEETIDRAGIRRAAYEAKLAERRKQDLAIRHLNRLGKFEEVKKLRKNEQENNKNLKSSYNKDKITILKDRSEEEKTDLTNEQIGKYRNRIQEEEGEEALALFDALDDKDKKELFTTAVENALKKDEAKRKLDLAREALDERDICKYASEISVISTQDKVLSRRVDVSLARQRLENARTQYRNARGKLSDVLSQEEEGSVREEVGNLARSLRERINSGANLFLTQAREKLGPVQDLVDRGFEGTRDYLQRAHTTFDALITERITNSFSTVNENFDNVSKQFQDEINLGRNYAERGFMNVSRTGREGIHNIAKRMEKGRSERLVNWEYGIRKQLGNELARIIAVSPEKRKNLREKYNNLEKERRNLVKERREEVDERMKENPHFDFFYQRFHERFVEETEAKTEDAVKAAQPEKSIPELLSENEENATDIKTFDDLKKHLETYESNQVVKIYIGEDIGEYLVIGWDGNKNEVTRMRENNDIVESKYDEYSSKEEMTKSVEEKLSSTEEDPGSGKIERGYEFRKDENGEWKIVKKNFSKDEEQVNTEQILIDDINKTKEITKDMLDIYLTDKNTWGRQLAVEVSFLGDKLRELNTFFESKVPEGNEEFDRIGEKLKEIYENMKSEEDPEEMYKLVDNYRTTLHGRWSIYERTKNK